MRRGTREPNIPAKVNENVDHVERQPSWPRVQGIVCVGSLRDFAAVILMQQQMVHGRDAVTAVAERWWPVIAAGESGATWRSQAETSGMVVWQVEDWAEQFHSESIDSWLARTWTESDCITAVRRLARRKGADHAMPEPTKTMPGQRIAKPVPPSGGLVLVLGDEALMTVAAAHAWMLDTEFHQLRDGRRLAQLLKDHAQSPITLVSDPLVFQDVCIAQTVAAHNGPIGVMARPTAALTRWLARYYSAPQSSQAPNVFVTVSQYKFQQHETIRVLGREAWSPDTLRAATGNEHDLLMLAVHGSYDRLFLGDLIIAGVPKAPGGDETNVIDAGAVRARHIFANTCSGLQIDNAVTGLDDSLAAQFLDSSVTSYTSTTSVKGNSWEECLLFHGLAHLGYPLGLCVSLVNRWLIGAGIDAPCFLLAGEPRGVLAQPSHPPWNLEDDGTNAWVLTFPQPTTGGLVAWIANPHIVALARARRLRVRLVDSAWRARSFVIAMEETAEVVIALCDWTAPSGPVRLHLTEDTMVPDGLRELCEQYPTRVRQLDWLHVAVPRTRANARIWEFEHEIARAQRLLVAEGASSVTPEAWQVKEHLGERLVQVQEAIIEDMLTRKASAAPLARLYRDHSLVASVRQAPPCRCGASAYHKKLLAPFAANHPRVVVVCRACGVTAHHPDPAPLRIDFVAGVRQDGNAVDVDVVCCEPRREWSWVTLAVQLTCPLLGGKVPVEARSEPVSLVADADQPARTLLTLSSPIPLSRIDAAVRLLALANMQLIILERPIMSQAEQRGGPLRQGVRQLDIASSG